MTCFLKTLKLLDYNYNDAQSKSKDLKQCCHQIMVDIETILRYSAKTNVPI